jgi:hypothetical protein
LSVCVKNADGTRGDPYELQLADGMDLDALCSRVLGDTADTPFVFYYTGDVRMYVLRDQIVSQTNWMTYTGLDTAKRPVLVFFAGEPDKSPPASPYRKGTRRTPTVVTFELFCGAFISNHNLLSFPQRNAVWPR